MAEFQICGGRPLRGTVRCDGMKNATVALFFAAFLVGERCIFTGVPQISDVTVALDILREMGVRVLWLNADTVRLDPEEACCGCAPSALTGKMRASYYLLGAELGRFGKTRVGAPGGCDFVSRPMDQHVKGFAALGVELATTETGYIAEGKPHGGRVVFDTVSVGATINTMLAAVRADGETTLVHAACEPHVVDVADFLIACGADIRGAGTDTIVIHGVSNLHGAVHAVVPDMIEAGTYLIAAAATGGHVRVTHVVPSHLAALTEVLAEMGVSVVTGTDFIEVSVRAPLHGCEITTAPYPGFATDLQPQMGALLAMSHGGGTLTEGVWDHRFRYVAELAKLGVHAEVDGNCAYFVGGDRLHGARARAVDLRAGAALIVAALAAEGTTTISEISHIKRGYAALPEKLAALGATILER